MIHTAHKIAASLPTILKIKAISRCDLDSKIEDAVRLLIDSAVARGKGGILVTRHSPDELLPHCRATNTMSRTAMKRLASLARIPGGSRTGEHCPATGWWTADRHGPVVFILEGSLMPSVDGGPAFWSRTEHSETRGTRLTPGRGSCEGRGSAAELTLLDRKGPNSCL